MTIAQVLAGEKRWHILTGKWQDVLTLPDRSVDHVITDPPYSEHTHSKSRCGNQILYDGNGNKNTHCAISREKEFGFAHITTADMEAVADLTARVSKRWALTFCDVESSHLWSGAMTSAGLDYCRTGAWIKIGGTPQFTGDRPAVGFEAVVICHPKGRKKWNGGGHPAVWSHLTCMERGGQARSNNTRSHPTQKPLDLMLELVGLFTDPGDLILDPYCGSGTTGVACLRLGRRFIGCEMNAEWAQLARDRMTAEEQQSTLSAARAGQLPMFGR